MKNIYLLLLFISFPSLFILAQNEDFNNSFTIKRIYFIKDQRNSWNKVHTCSLEQGVVSIQKKTGPLFRETQFKGSLPFHLDPSDLKQLIKNTEKNILSPQEHLYEVHYILMTSSKDEYLLARYFCKNLSSWKREKSKKKNLDTQIELKNKLITTMDSLCREN